MKDRKRSTWCYMQGREKKPAVLHERREKRRTMFYMLIWEKKHILLYGTMGKEARGVT